MKSTGDGLLIFDLGSSQLKAAIFDGDLQLVEKCQRPLTVWRDGARVEHTLTDMSGSIDALLAELADRLGNANRRIAAMGICAQRSTVAFWSRQEALAPVLSWQDLRTADEVQAMQRRQPAVAAEIARRTGLMLSAHYSATKIAWTGRAHATVRTHAAAEDFFWGPLTTWLIWKLTNGRRYAIDPTQAQRTLLYNIHQQQWDPWLAEQLKVSPTGLPQLLPTVGDYGDFIWNGQTIPIRVAIGDTQAACLGQGVGTQFDMGIQYGSGAFLAYATGTKMPHCPRLLTSVYFNDARRTHYFIEGTVNSAATLLDWLLTHPSIPQLRAAIKPALLLPALNGMGAPQWNTQIRPLWIGDADDLDVEDAAQRAIALRLREITEWLRLHGFASNEAIAVSGGLLNREGFLARQQKILRQPLTPVVSEESGMLGAAKLLAQHLGWKTATPKSARPAPAKAPTKSNAKAAISPGQWERVCRLGRWHFQRHPLLREETLWADKLTQMRPLFFGHRGFSAQLPENTLIAFQRAAQIGADGVEMDIRLSADGVPIIFHDHHLRRLAGTRGDVRELTLEQIRQLDVGRWFHQRFTGTRIPTLAEVFEQLPQNLLLYLEIKDEEDRPQLWQAVATMIDRYAAHGRVAVCSFNTVLAAEFKRARPDLCVGAILDKGERVDTDTDVYDIFDLLSLHHSLFNEKIRAGSRLKGQLALVWTVDDRAAMRRFVDLDVDGIVSNSPPSHAALS